jgi:hypothetical protein
VVLPNEAAPGCQCRTAPHLKAVLVDALPAQLVSWDSLRADCGELNVEGPAGCSGNGEGCGSHVIANVVRSESKRTLGKACTCAGKAAMLCWVACRDGHAMPVLLHLPS